MKRLIIVTLVSIGFVACSDNDPITEQENDSSAIYAEVLSDVSQKVITATYEDLYENASEMHSIAIQLTVGDESTLEDLKNAWQSTRAPWEKSEGFLYGPVDTEGIDPSIDSWPVDVNAIKNILESDQEITASLLESNNEARGFHTIEYFIWGLEGDKSADELTEREIEYLLAATQNLQDKTQQLYFGWLPEQGNFAGNFVDAGTSASIYSSQKAALEEIAEGMVIITDEVANGKIEVPLNGNDGSAKPEAEESRFSNNSKLDFANNIRSIQNVYLGKYDTNSGKGLSAIIAINNTQLDSDITDAISEAISAIEAIPGTFTDAIQENRSEVENAQAKVADLLRILESDMAPYISSL